MHIKSEHSVTKPEFTCLLKDEIIIVELPWKPGHPKAIIVES